MAIDVRTPIRSARELDSRPRFVVGESISWNSEPGRSVSWRPKDGVAAGRLLIVQSLYLFNGEDTPNLGSFLLLDADPAPGDDDPAHRVTDHARFAPGGITPVEVPPHRELCWTGQLHVPPGWKIGVRFEDMRGGAYCHWRYTAIEA